MQPKNPDEVAPKRGAWHRHRFDANIWGQLAGETLEGKLMLVRGKGTTTEVFVVPKALCVRKMPPARSTLIRLALKHKKQRTTGNGY